MEHSGALINKFTSSNHAENHYPIHQIQEDEGINWIVIDNNVVYNATNSYYEQIRLPNGDIHLRLVDIFTNPKNRSRPQLSQEADDQDYGGSE